MVFRCKCCGTEINLSVDWIDLSTKTEEYKCRKCEQLNTRNTPELKDPSGNFMTVQMETAEWLENGRVVRTAKLRLKRLLENV